MGLPLSVGVSISLIFSSLCSAQERSRLCASSMIEFKREVVSVVASNSGEYIARAEINESGTRPIVRLYRWKTNSYRLYKKITLNQSFPKNIFISDKGYLVLVGQRASGIYDDKVSIYSPEQDSPLVINTIDTKAVAENPLCVEKLPWVCRGSEIKLNEQELHAIDLGGNGIVVDLNSGFYVKQDYGRSCN